MLIDEIIDILSDESSSLSTALLKTKVLLHQIGRKELADWVNNELNGYEDNVEVPNYRILNTQVRANAASVAYQFTDHPIPTMHLEDSLRERFEKMKMFQSLSVLEGLCSNIESVLQSPIPMEFNGLLGEKLAGGVRIQSAWCTISAHDIKGVLTQVRSRLLDFILELKDSIGNPDNEITVKERAADIDTASMFNSAIFGNNTTIMVGNHNKQSTYYDIGQGNLDELLKVLTTLGIPADEIENLKIAVTDDEATQGKASFEGKTGGWFTKLLGRAAKGSLNVGVDVLSTAVTKAISSYIGLPPST